MYAVISGCLILTPEIEYFSSSKEEAQDFLYSLVEERLYALYYSSPFLKNNYKSLNRLADDFEIIKIMEVF